MRKFKLSKLVRDKIVQLNIDVGNTPNWRILTDKEYIVELKKKVLEEAKEVPAAEGKDLIKELVDLQEIIDSLLRALNISKEEFKEAQNKKNEKSGSFVSKQYIEDIEIIDGSEWMDYYLANPDRFPEIK